ncbi:hypothetical protein GCM10027521_22150 [Amycolatopsis cihanbeyliensis]
MNSNATNRSDRIPLIMPTRTDTRVLAAHARVLAVRVREFAAHAREFAAHAYEFAAHAYELAVRPRVGSSCDWGTYQGDRK